ncbi:MAG: CehA/McbA family metallohydrolase [Chloroflexi bacterium]|nr:CehA/McbA family metallohydrolase [Chloroflexota bacterium]
MSGIGTRLASPLARPIHLHDHWNASPEDLSRRFDPGYRNGLARVPAGDQVFRGLPFALGPATGRRWLLIDREITVDLRGTGRVSHVVVAHFADSWRDETGSRPNGVPVGWVVPAGQRLAHYEVTSIDGRRQTVEVRRRFEIDDGLIGWGYLPFLAVGHVAEEVVDWRGPHPRQSPGRIAATGDAGPLTMLPGAWGPDLTGVADHIPSIEDDVTCWLHTITLSSPSDLAAIRFSPADGARPGDDVVVAAVTVFDGTADPLALEPRRQIAVDGFGTALPDIDLGVAIRSLPATTADVPPHAGRPIGWGRPAAEPSARAVLDVAAAPDARLRFGDRVLAIADLAPGSTHELGSASLRPLPACDVRIAVTVRTAGAPTAARVRFVTDDGRYVPPLGHREEVNPGLFEDSGTDLLLGSDAWAYVPGTFEIDLPVGAVALEVVKGFNHRPERRDLIVDAVTDRLEIDLERVIELRSDGWITADSHVHFLAPSTALVQAAAEDVGLVAVLATQWGDQHTSVNDLAWGDRADPSGQHVVVVGTENRQNMLGHVALLGARRPVMPLSSGGGPEGRLGDAVSGLMADWADRCHAEGGMVVAAHFPLPFAEIATDILTGRIDAVEMQVFAPGLDNPSILEWYRFLNCGARLPVLGGTDKMSAGVPVGAVRTYARLDGEQPPSFEAWSAAVRAGRTFASSGPVIELMVDGHQPGDVITMPASGGRLPAHVRVRAAQAVVADVELVVNGRVVASEHVAAPTDELVLDADLDIRSGSWIAARSRSPHEIHSAFNTSMASHTSPIYVEVRGRPLFDVADAGTILEVVEGTRLWLRDLAAIRQPKERERMVELIAASAESLRAKIAASSAGGGR